MQTLEIAFLSVHDPEFSLELSHGSVTGAGGRELPYSYRLQPGPAPIVFLLPGLGSHRLDGGSLALAEMSWKRGFSVAILSSAMSWEFIAQGANAPMPGYTPADVEDLHYALDAVHRDLEANHPSRLRQRVLMGYSLGAYHALFIAAAERAGSPLVDFDRYVTLDAPVQLLTGMRKVDAFYEAQRAFPAAEREARVLDILWRTIALVQGERRSARPRAAPSEAPASSARADRLCRRARLLRRDDARRHRPRPLTAESRRAPPARPQPVAGTAPARARGAGRCGSRADR